MVIWGSYIYSPGLYRLSVYGMAGRQRLYFVEYLGHYPAHICRHMPYYENRCFEVGRDAGEQLFDRFKSTGRRANHDYVSVCHVVWPDLGRMFKLHNFHAEPTGLFFSGVVRLGWAKRMAIRWTLIRVLHILHPSL